MSSTVPAAIHSPQSLFWIEGEALKCQGSGGLTDRCRCCSCKIVFGSWKTRELESMLNLPMCSCPVDASATIHLIDKLDELERRDLGCSTSAQEEVSVACSDEEEGPPSCTITYQEWISRRLPVKLPPGLPRPPRQQPAACSGPALGLLEASDGDLEDDCDTWYNRNVAAGNFPDWMRQELQQQQQQQAEPEPSPASTSTSGSSIAVAAAADSELDAECDEWYQRHVASGLFASWLTVETSSIAAAVGAVPAAGLNDPRVTASAAAHPGLQLSTVGAAAAAAGDCDGCDEQSLPASPTGSESDSCRGASLGGFCSSSGDCSQVSSRSCSSRSLSSLDGESSVGSNSGSEEEEDACSAAVAEKREAGIEEREGGMSAASCRGHAAAQGFPPSMAECEDAVGATLRLVDCGAWEEAAESASAHEGCGSVGLCGLESGFGCGGLRYEGPKDEEGGYVPCGVPMYDACSYDVCPYDAWLDKQVDELVGCVVTGALFVA